MKYYIHYTIWNKESMVEWLLQGINYFIPKNSIIDIVFDNPIDSSLDIFLKSKSKWLNNYHVYYFISDKKYRFPNTTPIISSPRTAGWPIRSTILEIFAKSSMMAIHKKVTAEA